MYKGFYEVWDGYMIIARFLDCNNLKLYIEANYPNAELTFAENSFAVNNSVAVIYVPFDD